MKANSIRLCAVMGAALSLVAVPALAQAADLTLPDYVPPSALSVITTLLSIATTVIGSVAAIDAFIPEETKARLPWWVRLVWDLLAANVRHSKNAGAEPHEPRT